MSRWRIVGLTAISLLGFAGNSFLTRKAIAAGASDAASFTLLRLLSGALLLCLMATRDLKRSWVSLRHRLLGAASLFVYAVGFSFGYLNVPASLGALLVFGTTQLTLLCAALQRRERPTSLEWLGWAISVAALVFLVSRRGGVAAPLPMALMGLAGVGWGLYTAVGVRGGAPIAATAWNFVLAVPPALVVMLVARNEVHVTANGVWLAVACGTLTSALAYAAWYSVLPGVGAFMAAALLLLVPAIAALMGTFALGEQITSRLVMCEIFATAGVALAIFGRRQRLRAK